MPEDEKSQRWVFANFGAGAAVLGCLVWVFREPGLPSVMTMLAALIAAALVFSIGPD